MDRGRSAADEHGIGRSLLRRQHDFPLRKRFVGSEHGSSRTCSPRRLPLGPSLWNTPPDGCDGSILFVMTMCGMPLTPNLFRELTPRVVDQRHRAVLQTTLHHRESPPALDVQVSALKHPGLRTMDVGPSGGPRHDSHRASRNLRGAMSARPLVGACRDRNADDREADHGRPCEGSNPWSRGVLEMRSDYAHRIILTRCFMASEAAHQLFRRLCSSLRAPPRYNELTRRQPGQVPDSLCRRIDSLAPSCQRA